MIPRKVIEPDLQDSFRNPRLDDLCSSTQHNSYPHWGHIRTPDDGVELRMRYRLCSGMARQATS